jgi:hypothetical protein
MFDDAFIFFRYAENFNHGHGFVFNPGEKVEGYTSFLWLILMTIGDYLGMGIIIFSKIIGLFFATGCILLTAFSYWFIKSLTTTTSSIATLFLGTSGIFLPWGVSGVESTMFAFMILLMVLFYISIRENGSVRDFCFLGAIGGIAALTRPEGILVFLLLLLDQMIVNSKNRWHKLSNAILIFLIIIVPHFIWRYSYYGYPLPNTFYAKIGFNIEQVFRGLRYIVKFGIPALLIILPLADPCFARALLKKHRSLFPAVFIVVTYATYILLIGGDYMPGIRFFTPIMALICILSAAVISVNFGKKLLPVFIVIAVVYNIYQLNFYYITPLLLNEKVAENGKEAGLWLKENVHPDAVIATNTAGSIPYFSGLRAIDMLGLNDTHIAHKKTDRMGTRYAGHEKADGKYVLEKRPDYIQFWSSLGWEIPVFASDKQIFEIPEFHELYKLKTIVLPSGKKLILYEMKKSVARDSK